MRNQIFAYVAALAMGAGLAAAGVATAAPSDVAQIRALEDRFAAAVRAKDVAAIMRVYSPEDGLIVFDVSPPREYDGMAAYRADWQGLMAGTAGPLGFQLSGLRVEASGDMAYSHSIQKLDWTDPAGAAHTFTVRVTDVYRKRGGAWRIVHEHVSVPVDLSTGQGDLASAQ
jgi:uncharacterized protein (TIGR02246 family)